MVIACFEKLKVGEVVSGFGKLEVVKKGKTLEESKKPSFLVLSEATFEEYQKAAKEDFNLDVDRSYKPCFYYKISID
jgi:hypothetical protein